MDLMDGPEADHALAIKPVHASGSDQGAPDNRSRLWGKEMKNLLDKWLKSIGRKAVPSNLGDISSELQRIATH